MEAGGPFREFSESVERTARKICEVNGSISIERKANIL